MGRDGTGRKWTKQVRKGKKGKVKDTKRQSRMWGSEGIRQWGDSHGSTRSKRQSDLAGKSGVI